MGCAPSKSSSPDFDPNDKPSSPDDKKKTSPKSRKSPKHKNKGKDAVKEKEKINNNANDVKVAPDDNANSVQDFERAVEEQIITSNAAPVTATPQPGSEELKTPEKQNRTSAQRLEFFQPSQPLSSTTYQNGDSFVQVEASPIGSPPPKVGQAPGLFLEDDSAFFGSQTPGSDRPPKPQRTFKHVNWTDDDRSCDEDEVELRRGGKYSTFPRSRTRQRPVSERAKTEYPSGVKLARNTSLRERTIERRKDLDYRSTNVYLGRTLSPPGRGQMIKTTDFLEVEHDERPYGSMTRIDRGSVVKSMANAYQELLRQMEEDRKPKPPIRHHTKVEDTEELEADKVQDPESVAEKGVEAAVETKAQNVHAEDITATESESATDAESGSRISAIEVINKQLFPDYEVKEKKTIEDLEAEWEEERQRKREEEERIRQEEERLRQEEEERIRQEEERLRKEEEERIRQEEERLQKEEEERIRQEEEERLRKEEERLKEEEKQQEEQRQRAETEGKDTGMKS